MNFLGVSRSVFRTNITKLTDKGLADMEQVISTRMGNINKFCPWPALEQSFAEDLEFIWREQEFRKRAKQHKKDIEFAALNPHLAVAKNLSDMFTSGELK